PSPSANYYGFWNYRTDNGENPLIKGTRVYTLATVTVTHVGGTETPLFLSPTVPLGDAIALVSVTSPPQAAGGNPPDVTYSVGPDVILRSGRTPVAATAAPLTGTLTSVGTTITGAGTAFDTECYVGEALVANNEVRIITGVL